MDAVPGLSRLATPGHLLGSFPPQWVAGFLRAGILRRRQMFKYGEKHSAESVPDGAKWQFEKLFCEKKHPGEPLVCNKDRYAWFQCSICEKNGDGRLTGLSAASLRAWIHKTSGSQEGIEFIDPDSGKHWRVPRVLQQIIGDLEEESGCYFYDDGRGGMSDSKYLAKNLQFKVIPEGVVLGNQNRTYTCLPNDHVICEICKHRPLLSKEPNPWRKGIQKYTDCQDLIGRFQCSDCRIMGASEPPQFIYAIYGESNQLLKIGITDDPKDRFSSLSTQGGQRLNLFHLFESHSRSDVVKAEKEAHKIARKTRVIGEWFHPSNETFDAILMLQEHRRLKEVTFKTRLKPSIIKTRHRANHETTNLSN